MTDKTQNIILISTIAVSVVGLCFVGYKFRNKLLVTLIEKNNREKLAEAHPLLKNKASNFLIDLKLKGYEPLITSLNRDFAKQNELHIQDSRNAPAGMSLHNYGIAMDINIMKNDKSGFIGMNQSDELWQPIVEIAKKNGLDWGGGGKFGSYNDRVHFQPKDFKYKGSDLLAMKNEGKIDKNGFVKV